MKAAICTRHHGLGCEACGRPMNLLHRNTDGRSIAYLCHSCCPICNRDEPAERVDTAEHQEAA